MLFILTEREFLLKQLIMNKLKLFSAIFFLSSTIGSAQTGDVTRVDHSQHSWRHDVNFGLKIGANYSNVYSVDAESFNTDPKFGLAAGMFLSIPLGEAIQIQPEILFSQKGYQASGSLLGQSYIITRTSNYIDVPLLIGIKAFKGFTILAGPQYSFLISQKNKFENSATSIAQETLFDNEDLRKNTLCFTGGFDLNFDQLIVGTRVGWDLYKNNKDGTSNTPRYKNVWYQLCLGYRF